MKHFLFWAPHLLCIAFAAFLGILALDVFVSKWGQLDWSGYVLIEAPLLLLGVLFLGSWRNRQVLTPRAG